MIMKAKMCVVPPRSNVLTLTDCMCLSGGLAHRQAMLKTYSTFLLWFIHVLRLYTYYIRMENSTYYIA